MAPTDAKSAVEAAIYTALAGAIRGATVYQDAPDDAPNPLVVIGDLKSARLLGKPASRDRRVTVTIITLVEADERRPLLDLMAQIDAALDGQMFEPAGWSIEVDFADDEAALTEDGATYAGVSTFTCLALAA